MRALAVTALVLAACASSPAPAPASAPKEPAPAAVTELRPYPGPRAADARWADAWRRLAAAAAPAADRVRAETGLGFEPGRGPLLTVVDAAPDEQDAVALRFVDGVRRPVVRVPAARLLSGEWRAEDELVALLVDAAIVARAGEREVPPWVRAGVSVVAGGSFDRVLRERALRDPSLRLTESALFPSSPADALTAAARIRALARCGRGDAVIERFVGRVADGAAPETALAEVGIEHIDFLDAAAATERERAARALADDPLARAVRDARASLAAGGADRADVALAPFAARLGGASLDLWFAAEARIQLAEIAFARGETKTAASHLDAALADPAHLASLRAARTLRLRAASVLGERDAGRRLSECLADFGGDESSRRDVLRAGLPALGGAPGTSAADAASGDAARRRDAAAKLGEWGSPAALPLLRVLAADADASVRRAAILALGVVSRTEAADDFEAATRDADAGVRRSALDLLVVADRARAVTRAAAMKDDADAAVRASAAALLPVPKPPPARPAPAASAKETATEFAAPPPRPAEPPRPPVPLPPPR